MRTFASVLALSLSLTISAAYAAPQAGGSPVRDLTVQFNCNGSQPDLSRYWIQAQSQDNHWVQFDSSADNQLVVYSGVLFIQVPSQLSDRPPVDLEIGHILGPAACEPADDGSGYGNSFTPAYLNVMLDSDVSLVIVAGTKMCEPGLPNSDTLNSLAVTVSGRTYSLQPSSCN